MKKLLLVVLVLIGLQTQAQTWNYCDSLNMNMEVIEDPTNQSWFQYYLNGTYYGQANNDTTIGQYYTWTVQNMNISPPCADWYNGNNILVTLPTSIYDTLKICWTVDLIFVDCTVCDTLVYDYSGNSPFNGKWTFIGDLSSPLSIQEYKNNSVLNNKMYDLLGREITEVSIGTIYIRNGKKYIRTK